MCTPGNVLIVCAKNEGDRAYGLGVSEHTHTQTEDLNNNIDGI